MILPSIHSVQINRAIPLCDKIALLLSQNIQGLQSRHEYDLTRRDNME